MLTPNYYKSQMTAEALRRHFEAVADASPIPVLLYSVPAFTGLTFPPGLAATLAAHPRIVGMKESSGDLSLLGRIVAAVPQGFAVACGSAPVLYPALCIGADAGIVAVSCCAPAVAVALYHAFAEGDHVRARRLQDVVTPLGLAITTTYGVAGLKAAIDLAGLRGGHVRSPLLPVPEAARDGDRHAAQPGRAGRARARARGPVAAFTRTARRERPPGVFRRGARDEHAERPRLHAHLDPLRGRLRLAVAVEQLRSGAGEHRRRRGQAPVPAEPLDAAEEHARRVEEDLGDRRVLDHDDVEQAVVEACAGGDQRAAAVLPAVDERDHERLALEAVVAGAELPFARPVAHALAQAEPARR